MQQEFVKGLKRPKTKPKYKINLQISDITNSLIKKIVPNKKTIQKIPAKISENTIIPSSLPTNKLGKYKQPSPIASNLQTKQEGNSYTKQKYFSKALTKTPKFLIKVMVIILVGIFSVYIPPFLEGLKQTASTGKTISIVSAWGDKEIEIWWPIDKAKVSGTQPFKAIVSGRTVENYNMYWQVDGGQLNAMYNSNQDHPHKEAMVDLSGWTWKGNGPYTISFVAKEGDNKLAERFVTIYLDSANSMSVALTEATITKIENVITTQASAEPIVEKVLEPVSVSTIEQKQLDVWWPVNNASVSGPQPFKAMLQNSSVSDFNMYWQLNNGSLNEMPSNYDDYPHKESIVDVSAWKNAGSHSVNFIAKNNAGEVVGKNTVSFNVNSVNNSQVTTTVTPPAPAPAPVQTSVKTSESTSQKTVSASSSSSLSGAKLYVNPNNPAKKHAESIRSHKPTEASMFDKIGNNSQAVWLGGWNSNVGSDVNNVVSLAENQGSVPVFVTYNIPQRDCGGYSAGGVNSPESYKEWVRAIAKGIGNRKAAVVLEPDALALTSCLSSQDQQTRFDLIKDAVSVFKALGNTSVYVDAAHPGWVPVADMAARLKKSGIDQASGFALNVSNFVRVEDNVNYGQSISDQLGGKHFVVDTSRNGSGATSDYQWCNPSGRSLGKAPTTNTGNSKVDAFLWIKTPGESDGNCNGGPNAGVFWPDYALGLAQRAAW